MSGICVDAIERPVTSFYAQVVLHDPEKGPLCNELKYLRYGTVAENNAELAAPTKPVVGDMVKYRRKAPVGGRRRRPGPWVEAASRTEAGRQTGLTYATVKGAINDGKPRRGKNGVHYEFIDASKPADIGSFKEVRVLRELLEREPHANVKNAYLGRTFVDTDTKERFTVCKVWNNYDSPELEDVDHSLRLCLRFYDAKKYKKTPAKKHWLWCQVASMAADGYEFVDDGVSARAVVSKKRKTRSKSG